MSQSSAQDKTEKATPQKIRKAREQGQIHVPKTLLPPQFLLQSSFSFTFK